MSEILRQTISKDQPIQILTPQVDGEVAGDRIGQYLCTFPTSTRWKLTDFLFRLNFFDGTLENANLAILLNTKSSWSRKILECTIFPEAMLPSANIVKMNRQIKGFLDEFISDYFLDAYYHSWRNSLGNLGISINPSGGMPWNIYIANSKREAIRSGSRLK